MKVERSKFLAMVAMIAACDSNVAQYPQGGAAPPSDDAGAATVATVDAAAPVASGPAKEGVVVVDAGPAKEGGVAIADAGPAAEGQGPAVEGAIDPTIETECRKYPLTPCAEGLALSSCMGSAGELPPTSRAKYYACLASDLSKVKAADPACAAISPKCSAAEVKCQPLRLTADQCHGKVKEECKASKEAVEQRECWATCRKSFGTDNASAIRECPKKCGVAGSNERKCTGIRGKSCKPADDTADACTDDAAKSCTVPTRCQSQVDGVCQKSIGVIQGCFKRSK